MKQNRFYSAVYIIGTGLAISMVMVLAIAWHIRTTNIAPETQRDRMLYLTALDYKKGKSSYNFFFGVRTVKECLYPLKLAEAVAVTTNPTIISLLSGDSYVQLPGGDNPQKAILMAANDGFWKVFSFSFVEGKPFNAAEFQSGVPRAVMTVSLAQKLFGESHVTGKSFLLNDVEYIISGVVKDVSSITPSVFANLWVPYTTLPEMMETELIESDGSVGTLVAYILPAKGFSQKEVADELDGLIGRYNASLQEGEIALRTPLDSHQTHIVRQFVGLSIGNNVEKDGGLRFIYIVLGLLVLLFLLVPALNLSGLNASHMQDRIAELGVRQAFGARKAGLLLQVLIENMVLMLPGGCVGLLFSYLLIFFFQKLLLAPGMLAMLAGMVDTSLTPGMLLNLLVFFYAFLVCLLLNIISSMVPVWRSVQMNITDALNS